MGATIKGDTIYISKDLLAKITLEERKIILAHEISHWQHKDNIKLIFIKFMFFFMPPVINYFKRKFEMRADREAIKRTKDINSFVSLLEKLKRNSPEYPSMSESLALANQMRGII